MQFSLSQYFFDFANTLFIHFSDIPSVQFSSVTRLCPTLCYHNCSTSSLPVFTLEFTQQLPSLLKLMFIESVVVPFNHFILCNPLLQLPSIFPNIRVFSNESVLHVEWLKHCSFSFNISPSNEHSGLISFGMDWLDLLAVQGTLKVLQHHSSKAKILRCSALFQRRQWQPTPVRLPGNPMEGRAWWAAVSGVAESQTRLNNFTFAFHFHALEKEMATHSSVLAWRTPGSGEPGGLPPRGSSSSSFLYGPTLTSICDYWKKA